jgi:hypothetical protein
MLPGGVESEWIPSSFSYGITLLQLTLHPLVIFKDLLDPPLVIPTHSKRQIPEGTIGWVDDLRHSNGMNLIFQSHCPTNRNSKESQIETIPTTLMR